MCVGVVVVDVLGSGSVDVDCGSCRCRFWSSCRCSSGSCR